MEKIASFRIDHIRLNPGLYVSRRDEKNALCVTTFDLRFTAPNREPVMDMPAVHTIEHLGASFLRSSARKADIVYFGPMGCRTGFYLILAGETPVETVRGLMADTFRFIADYEGAIPGASPRECGNYSDMDLPGAKARAAKYLTVLEE